jgi:predicted DNA-binding transcriptional regulator YafY
VTLSSLREIVRKAVEEEPPRVVEILYSHPKKAGMTYRVEPYLIETRSTKAFGPVDLFWARRTDLSPPEGIRSFRIDRIIRVEITEEEFEPKWEISI